LELCGIEQIKNGKANNRKFINLKKRYYNIGWPDLLALLVPFLLYLLRPSGAKARFVMTMTHLEISRIHL